MGDSGKPVPSGAKGITLRSAQLQAGQRSPAPPQAPLDAREMWDRVVQPKRGFESRPYNADDKYRNVSRGPIDPRLDPGLRGSPVGFGVDTVGAVQVTHRDGKQSWISVGHFTEGGAENHAEARSLEGLRAQAPKDLQGAKITVVVDQTVCPNCRKRLLAYADEVGAESVEIYHPRLEDERTKAGSGVMKGAKSSSKDSFRGPNSNGAKRPPLDVRLEERIITGKPGNGPGGSKLSSRSSKSHSSPAVHNSEIRTAVRGACLNLAAGVSVGIFQEWYKSKMLADLEKMPKLTLDPDARRFFSDPAAQQGIKAIDVMSKNIEPFARELAEHHQTVIGAAVLELIVLRVSQVPDTEAFEFLEGMQNELDVYWDALRMVEENLEATKRIAPQALEAAQAAEELRAFMQNALVMDQLVKLGLSIQEISQMQSNLAFFAARVRRSFQAVDALQAQVALEREQLAELSSEVNRLYWQIGLRIFAKEGQELKLNQRWPPAPSSKSDKPAKVGDTKTSTPAKSKQEPTLTVPVTPLL